MNRIAVMATALAACHAPHVAATSPATAAGAAPVAAVPTRIAIRIDTDARVERRVHVTLDFPPATALVFRPSRHATLSDLPDGFSIQGERIVASSGAAFTHVRYAVSFDEESGDATAPFAETIELRAMGADLLALPESEARRGVDLRFFTGGAPSTGASSFALGGEQHFDARADELANAYFLVGDVGTAVFHAGDGDDFTAWLGPTAFDARWIGAEIAATRGLVDEWIGRSIAPNSPPMSLLFASVKRDDMPVVVVPRTRGFLVSVDRRATWNAGVRLLVAQSLASRYLGGFLRIASRYGAQDGDFFSGGFSRTVGREVIYEAGILDAADRAAEMNQLLATVAFSDPAKDTRHLEIAEGALLATSLDVELQKRKTNLRRFLREIIIDAAQRTSDAIAFENLRLAIEKATIPEFAMRFKDVLEKHVEVPLPVDLLGRCWRLERRSLVPFELGFATTAGEELTVRDVTPKSRAAAAGLRVGDIVATLDYRNGNPNIPVKLAVKRGDKKIPMSFIPAGAAKSGRVFERVSGIPDDRCSGP